MTEHIIYAPYYLSKIREIRDSEHIQPQGFKIRGCGHVQSNKFCTQNRGEAQRPARLRGWSVKALFYLFSLDRILYFAVSTNIMIWSIFSPNITFLKCLSACDGLASGLPSSAAPLGASVSPSGIEKPQPPGPGTTLQHSTRTDPRGLTPTGRPPLAFLSGPLPSLSASRPRAPITHRSAQAQPTLPAAKAKRRARPLPRGGANADAALPLVIVADLSLPPGDSLPVLQPAPLPWRRGIRPLGRELAHLNGSRYLMGEGLPLLVLRLPLRSGTPRPKRGKSKSAVCPPQWARFPFPGQVSALSRASVFPSVELTVWPHGQERGLCCLIARARILILSLTSCLISGKSRSCTEPQVLLLSSRDNNSSYEIVCLWGFKR